MDKKYELSDVTKEIGGFTLHRIRALKDFSNVKKGDLGGWVKSEDNLSHEGDCWVCGSARVYDNAWVYGGAIIRDNARVYGDARVCENALVYGSAWVYGGAIIRDNARVYGDACVYGHAQVSDNAVVCGDIKICDNAKVYDDAVVHGTVSIYNSAEVFDIAQVHGSDIDICDNAKVCGNAEVFGNAHIYGNAFIYYTKDCITINGIGSRLGTTTAFITKDKDIMVKCGCFYGNIKRFEEQVKETHKNNNKYRREYLAAIEIIKVHFELKWY